MVIKRREVLNLMTGLAMAIASPLVQGLAKVKKVKSVGASRTLVKPFFLGWYSEVKEPFNPQLVSSDINVMLPYVRECDGKPIKAYLDAAHKAGRKIILEICIPLVETGNISGIPAFVRTYKNHPAVAAWYLYDEPETKHPRPTDPILLTNMYRAIKQEDPFHPVTLAMSKVNMMEPYTSATDIIMWDEYPCYVDRAEFSWAPKYREQLQTVSSFARTHKKPFWNILQGYGGNGTTLRLPTKGELRYMFYASVIAGSESCLFWMLPWSTAAWNESILHPTLAEFREYIPSVKNGGRLVNLDAAVANNLEIKLYSIPKTKKVLAIAINHSQNRITSTVKIDRKFAKKIVTVNRQKVTNLSPQGNLTIVLQPYEARLYKIG